MDDRIPLNRNQLIILDFVEQNPGCLFEALLDYMQSQKLNWRDWFPEDYEFLQAKQLIVRDLWPQTDALHPDRKPGNVKLFPKLSIVTTDEKNEPLSDDARALLAFIRDNPGLREMEIMKQMSLDERSFILAFRLVRAHGLIVQTFVPYPNPQDPHNVPGYATYYPA